MNKFISFDSDEIIFDNVVTNQIFTQVVTVVNKGEEPIVYSVSLRDKAHEALFSVSELESEQVLTGPEAAHCPLQGFSRQSVRVSFNPRGVTSDLVAHLELRTSKDEVVVLTIRCNVLEVRSTLIQVVTIPVARGPFNGSYLSALEYSRSKNEHLFPDGIGFSLQGSELELSKLDFGDCYAAVPVLRLFRYIISRYASFNIIIFVLVYATSVPIR